MDTLPEIDKLIARARLNLNPAAPDDPDLPCCGFCGAADSPGTPLTAEDGFGADLYCQDATACAGRHSARVAPWPVPDYLAKMRSRALA